MPIYEYVCDEPGKEPVVIELLRSVAEADKPVPDPEGKGRLFKRRLSVFASGGNGGPEGIAVGPGGHVHSGTCGCGKRRGSCGMG